MHSTNLMLTQDCEYLHSNFTSPFPRVFVSAPRPSSISRQLRACLRLRNRDERRGSRKKQIDPGSTKGLVTAKIKSFTRRRHRRRTGNTQVSKWEIQPSLDPRYINRNGRCKDGKWWSALLYGLAEVIIMSGVLIWLSISKEPFVWVPRRTVLLTSSL